MSDEFEEDSGLSGPWAAGDQGATERAEQAWEEEDLLEGKGNAGADDGDLAAEDSAPGEAWDHPVGPNADGASAAEAAA